ncbi:MAG TPA: fused MFS/spermidine synthase [Gemmataceae bacterium]|nr:fused MFS/spermidine synthase [Gemmataceae bacterium]
MASLFAATLLAGALLLFAVQPMTGRMLLPLLGGSPAVWNTCLVFFQGMLLLGYLYSHLTTRYFGLRRQPIVHLVLLAVVPMALPIAVTRTDPPAGAPAAWLLVTLLISVGLPFFAVSTTSPLLQRWYAGTRARGAADPYFLSVASNVGCLAALLAYPVLIEPALTLSEQSDWWRWGYVAYAGLVAVCAVVMLGSRRQTTTGLSPSPPASGGEGRGEGGLGRAERHEPPDDDKIGPLTGHPLTNTPLTPHASPPEVGGEGNPNSAGARAYSPWRWLLLAFIPASLLTGVTQAVTTDIAPIPLLWVVPLSLYLITFIIAFTPGLRLPLGRLGKVLAICAIALAFTLLTGATEPVWLVLPIHLVTFFVAALACHGRLAAERPPADRLTSYYLWMSLGGVLGGGFNALVAPYLFHRLGFVEYPLALLAACLVRPVPADRLRLRGRDFVGPIALGAAVVGIILLAQNDAPTRWVRGLSETTALPAEMIKSATCFGLPLIFAYMLVERPVRFALGLGAIFLAGTLDAGAQGRPLHVERNFLGVVKITASPDGQFTRMVHGNTVHGQQRNAPRPKYVASFAHAVGATSALNELSILAMADGRWDDRRRPLTYYHPTGPAGVTFRLLVDGWTGPRRIGAVGLGTGAIASYARPNQDWTFYELDPAVEKLARDDRYFTFLRDSHARSLNVVIGDARLRLAAEPDATFDLLVLDAFSSDAIPIHLLTAEAFAMYERKLAPGGVILLHLSNRYLELSPVVGRVVTSMPRPMVMRQNDDMPSEREKEEGKDRSVWVIVARRDEDFGPLQKSIRGFYPARRMNGPRWTDDRANLWGTFRRSED